MELQRQSFSSRDRQQVTEIGKTIEKGVKDKNQRESVKEKYEELVEAAEDFRESEAFGDDTDLYSTLQANMIEEALEPELLAQDAIRSMDFNLGQGYDSIQVPTGNALSAVGLNSDGTLTEDTTDYDSVSISIDWVGVRTTFSGQIVNKAAVDLLAFRMEQAGRAIARKVDADIVAEMVDAGSANGSYGDQGNYLYGGNNDGTVNDTDGFDSNKQITYDVVINGIEVGINNDAVLDLALASPGSWSRLHQDQDVKDVLAFTATQDGDFSMVQNFGPLRLMTSSQITADKVILVDTDKTAMFVDASPVETFDGRVNEAYQFEILAVKAYGVKILQPQSLVVIHENTDDPVA